MSSGISRSQSVPTRNALPPRELLDDLCSRFVLNCPKEDLQSFERILFLIEYAHWFYEDNAMEQNPSLKSLSLREFTSCLLVKGWKAGASWSFPRGKKAKDEEDHMCAIREVLEETGFDISNLLKVDDNIEVIIGQQRVRLYIIGGVKGDTVFAPQTKKEISEIAWHRVDELPPTNIEASSRGPNGMKYFMVGPFIRPLKAWITDHYPPPAANYEGSLKGSSTCVWRAKSNSPKSNSVPGINSLNEIVPITESYSSKSVINDDFPGKSFRNFRFDSKYILQSIDNTTLTG
uniref:Nudix hydrolase domain-containing protein n=1 Tax=Araucaria cunninghamii TaxID=56994 RepID=A0A0D6R7H7_ARACU